MSDRAKMYVILALSFVSAHTLSIGTVTDRNVTKRETDVSDVFPDFEYQHRSFDESSKRRKTPVKRLALPVNFLLRLVAESDGDDYYLSQAGGEGGDNYENKDWSDTNRPVSDNDPKSSNLFNLTDIEDVSKNINETSEKQTQKNSATTDDNDSEDETTAKPDRETNIDDAKVNRRQSEVNVKDDEEEEDDDDNNSETTQKPESSTTEDDEAKVNEESDSEKAEAEAKKKAILDAVDQLKERHALEQRIISQRHNSDELFLEERERDKITPNHRSIQRDKYAPPGLQTHVTDYDEYPEYDPVFDKYSIITLTKPTTTTTTTSTTTERTNPTTYYRNPNDKYESNGKLSVFKNPQEYMIDLYESSDEAPKTEAAKIIEMTTPKRSSKYMSRTTLNPENNDRLSFIPIGQVKKGEPALFIPKKRKHKKLKMKHNKPVRDSVVAATVTEPPIDKYRPQPTNASSEAINSQATMDTTVTASAAVATSTGPSGSSQSASVPSEHLSRTTGPSESGPGVTGPSANEKSSSVEVTSSGEDVGSSTSAGSTAADSIGLLASTAVDHTPVPNRSSDQFNLAIEHSDVEGAQSDAEPAHSNKEEDKEPEDSEHEHGGHKSHHAEHHNSFTEGGKKAYEGYHEDSKAEKGHHDKEKHSGEYQDAAGHDKEHHKETAHFGEHKHEEHGKKHAQYEESGKHSQGHSTKGSHDIHKKEEYEKKVEFFEEDGDSGEEEKAGGHHAEKKHKSGGRFAKNSHDSDYKNFDKGDQAKFEKGGHGHAIKGHKSGAGHDAHGHHESSHLHKAGKQTGNKWVYHHGYPAKTANLVIIDRRSTLHP